MAVQMNPCFETLRVAQIYLQKTFKNGIVLLIKLIMVYCLLAANSIFK